MNNGINNYSGTYDQKLKLLNLLKQGKLNNWYPNQQGKYSFAVFLVWIWQIIKDSVAYTPFTIYFKNSINGYGGGTMIQFKC